ncbi:alpha-2-macroglobulin-like isoform X1 [Alosa sapidissima]|uniref:alpha-2-macroglobulin-like isoform X1 n=1 Tax=Alosa sapidissima TaxID=34773 RepID=UPI001C08D026|nr:alpha-2-macroglobulin-like isoform X1 [Alosa sapidissima]
MALTRILIAGGLLSCLYTFCSSTATPDPSFLVTFPAQIWSESEAKLCASLLSPNETLLMSIYLTNGDEKKMLHQETSDKDFHRCFQFQAPLVKEGSVQKITVEVKGQTSYWTSESRVKFRPKPAPVTFIQTDKPIYTPGQTVHFRVVTMDTKFIPLDQEYHTMSLTDSHGNTIGQWLNVTSERKIVQLSHALNPEAARGHYTLSTHTHDRIRSHRFQVQKYVLPKFDVTTKVPEQVSVGAEEMTLEVCAKYTFGQPVPGMASMSLCRNASMDYMYNDSDELVEGICLTHSAEMKASGCASFIVRVSELTQGPSATKLRDTLTFNVTVAEEGTGISRSTENSITVDFSIGKVTFEELPTLIEEKAVMKGKVRATHYNGTGIAHKTIHLMMRQAPSYESSLLQNLTTDADGLAHFSFNTTPFPGDIELIATTLMEDHVPFRTPYYDSVSKTVSRLKLASPHTPTSSSLSINKIDDPLQCGKDVPITIKYTFTGETFSTDSVDVIYMVVSKGQIVHHGFAEASVKGSSPVTEGEVFFQLFVRAERAPSVHVLAYCVLPSETVLADSKTFSTEKCFRNKVSVQFSPPKAVPGEESSLQLSAQPGSLCGLSAVDQSISILEPGKGLNTDKIFGLLPDLESRVSYDVEDPEKCLPVRPRRSVMPGPYYPGSGSQKGPTEAFKRLGLKAITNLVVKNPDCLLFKGNRYERHFGMYRHMEFDSQPDMAMAMPMLENSPLQTVRTVFPETWIWDLAEVGESGEARVPLTVPDTITTWDTEAFCLSPQGFGLAPPVQLTVFQPFFLELSLPYSIIRGETFELKATVFNYLPKCIMVTVTPASSSDFTLTPSSDGQYSSCLCANGRKTFKWTLVPSVLGEMGVTVSAAAEPSQTVCGNEVVTVPERGRTDTVTRSLKVKAEGTEKSESFSWLLCPKGGALTEEVELKLPAALVKGSAKASVSVLGDILGRALKNIDSLLRMPYGCGEQNMAILSPNIYILQYLQNTGQLTADIKEKATNFLKNGYQRQLNYKHRDGAYSTFGSGQGNTWLTAFVLRSFGKATSFIYIDPQIITDAKTWLEKKLQPDGVYHMQGKLFNNRMKGGVSDNVTITAYITASMLELNMSVTEETKRFLKSSVSDLSNTYTTALLAYTFSLAGEEDIRAELLKHLDSKATSGGSHLHWSQSSSERADSLAVETSSYVLLAVLTKPTLTAADLGYASRIVSWLVKQQNPYGGFSSTQDTVVALQALALYATKVFSPHGSSTVTVQSAGGDKHQFDVNQHNTLLYQETALQDVPGKYSVEVKGSTCASVGVALFYNIPTPTEHSTLSIKTQAKPLTEGECNKANGQAFSLNIAVQYDGPQESTNMAIIDVKMLSGFTPDSASVERLKGSMFVDRVDKKDDHILAYLSEVPKGLHISYQLTIRQDLPVNNLKPAVVKVYDYYQTSDQAEAEYHSPCA